MAMKASLRPRLALLACVAVCPVLWGANASADAPTSASSAPAPAGRDTSVLGELVVTATKQAGGQLAQKAPLSVVALSGQQIDTLHATDLRALTAVIPNIDFSSASFAHAAQFSIRGNGLDTSDPGSDPVVGVFEDGVYYGVTEGVLTSMFDLSSVEVLRGPQGILFGRNVTGGAVLINTQRPTDAFSAYALTSIESGPELGQGLAYTAEGAVGGPIGGGFSARLALREFDDTGYWHNDFLNNNGGKDNAFVVRPSLRYANGDFEANLTYEHGDQRQDGAISTAYSTVPGHDDLTFNGFDNLQWNTLAFQTDYKVPFGNGTITNIAAYRDVDDTTLYDPDGTPTAFVSVAAHVAQAQESDELRYNGNFGRIALTTGLYYLHEHIFLVQRQVVLSTTSDQGGEQDSDAVGLFAQADAKITDRLTLTLGGRETYEDKNVHLASIGHCNYPTLSCTWQFNPNAAFSAFTPKGGLNYQLTDHAMIYATAQEAQRSGGFPLRFSNTVQPPAYQPETDDSYEIGLKSDLWGGRTRLNVDAFYSQISGLQRTVGYFDPTVNHSINTTFNAGNARIEGFEVEFDQSVTPDLIVSASAGYTDAKYTKVVYDLNNDGVINGKDLALKLPLAPKWTYSLQGRYSHLFPVGRVAAQVGWHYQSSAFYDIANVGLLPGYGRLDLNFDYSPTPHWTLSLFVKNTLNQFILDAKSPITATMCQCVPQEGRITGLQLRWDN